MYMCACARALVGNVSSALPSVGAGVCGVAAALPHGLMGLI